MTIKYDVEADAAYVRLSDAPNASNREISDVCVVDLDGHGNLVGIELLSVFGFAGSALADLVRNGLITHAQSVEIMQTLRSELVPA